jgi:hypothetical protein
VRLDTTQPERPSRTSGDVVVTGLHFLPPFEVTYVGPRASQMRPLADRAMLIPKA